MNDFYNDFFLVADGSNEYRYESDEIPDSDCEQRLDNWFTFNLMPVEYRQCWTMGLYQNLSGDEFDGNF